MRLLVDSCVGLPTVVALREAGHDVDYVVEWDRDPGDDDILRQSVEQGRVLISRDKDFGELIFRDGHDHLGILRLVGLSVRTEPRVAVFVIAFHESELLSNAIITAGPSSIRIRP